MLPPSSHTTERTIPYPAVPKLKSRLTVSVLKERSGDSAIAVPVAASARCLAHSVRVPRGWIQSFQTDFLLLSLTSKFQFHCLTLVQAFSRLNGLLCLLLTSALPSRRFSAALASYGSNTQTSPGNSHDFHAYARPIYMTCFRTGIGL